MHDGITGVATVVRYVVLIRNGAGSSGVDSSGTVP
jgi:hypothetical protein